MDFIKSFTLESQPGSQVTITGEIPYSELEAERERAITHLGKNLKVDGFRPGHIPEKVITERIGEMAILGEMAERAIARIYPVAVKTLEIDSIGYPAITITKIAPGNPLGFTATVAVVPSMKLPDYRARAKSVNAVRASAEVTDADVETAIADIVRQQRAYARLQASAQNGQTHTHADGTVHPGPAHGDINDLPTPETVAEEEAVPELTDEYVKTLGKFETVDDFKTTIREHLVTEKERDATAAHRAKLTDAIIEQTEIDLPQVLIDSELREMFARMEEELSHANLRMDDYLAHIHKTKETLFEEWTPAAEKRAKLQLVLNEISKREDVKADENLVSEQVATILKQYPDADTERVRIYVESILKNEAVMKLLETT